MDAKFHFSKGVTVSFLVQESDFGADLPETRQIFPKKLADGLFYSSACGLERAARSEFAFRVEVPVAMRSV